MSSTPLEDYALLSDTQTAALISRHGSVDWLCVPRFDSQAVFSALLGEEKDGFWRIHVPDGEVIEHRYRTDTFVTETIWQTDTGKVRVTDFMPVETPVDALQTTDLVRMVECLEGEVELHNELRLRFDYGASTPYCRSAVVDGFDEIHAVAGPNSVYVRGPRFDLQSDVDHHAGKFFLSEGDCLNWVLTWAPSYLGHPASPDYSGSLGKTLKFWRDWISDLEVNGDYIKPVTRSILVLRALTQDVTGGIVAAPTTSLPEEFGGERNWDYRYVWLRDSALTIEVLAENGFDRSALDWRDWLLRAIAGDSHELRVMYGLGGERHMPEYEMDHLSGYENSRPVRIGNAASEQYQADVVGEVMVALEHLREAGIDEDEFSWEMQKAILDFQEARYDAKDQGIWEMRGEPSHFTHGRAMMWAAFDRGVRGVEKYGLDGPVEHWRKLREQLAEEIMTHGWNSEINSFTQTYDNTEVDASLLQLAQIGFVDYQDPKMLGTVARIESDLLDDAGFLHRYRTSSGMDGLSGDEYPFLICSFWLIEQYARSGRIDDAREGMDRVLSVRNHLGLLAEEYSSEHQRLAGNFPQAFSHLGLVRAAYAINHADPDI